MAAWHSSEVVERAEQTNFVGINGKSERLQTPSCRDEESKSDLEGVWGQ